MAGETLPEKLILYKLNIHSRRMLRENFYNSQEKSIVMQCMHKVWVFLGGFQQIFKTLTEKALSTVHLMTQESYILMYFKICNFYLFTSVLRLGE